jgi:hypothetical protein
MVDHPEVGTQETHPEFLVQVMVDFCFLGHNMLDFLEPTGTLKEAPDFLSRPAGYPACIRTRVTAKKRKAP